MALALDAADHAAQTWGMDIPKLLQGMIDRGWTQAALAARLSTTQDSVSRWLREEREPSGPAKQLIRELAVEIGIISDERAAEAATRNFVKVMGEIGAGALVEPDEEQVPADGIEQVELPYPIDDDVIGFRVKGDSMAPTYEDKAIIIVQREQPSATDSMIGLAAAVTIYGPEGKRQRYLKRIRFGGRPHTFNLESINDRSPMIRNARIIWASPVRMIIPNIGLRTLTPKRRASAGRKAPIGKER